jgi:predicted dehydrogenase
MLSLKIPKTSDREDTMNKIKMGLIGAGFIGPAHVEAVRRLGYVDVIALSELNQDLADQKATQLSIPKAYGDYHALLENKEVQVIHNCTPNFQHFKVIKAAIENGKHIISEKPLTLTADHSAKLVKMAEEARVINAVNFCYRHYPLVQQVKAMVSKGDIGRVYTVHGSYLQDWLLYEQDYNWRLEPQIGGTSRAIADIGSHWCDTIQFATSLRITEVMADLMTVLPIRKKPKRTSETFASNELHQEEYEEKPITTEDYGSVLFSLENGAKGVFTVSQVSAGRKNRLYFEIDGATKAVAWNQEHPNYLWIGQRDRPNQYLMKDSSLLYPSAQTFTDYPGGHNEAYPDILKMFLRNVYSFIIRQKDPCRDQPNFPTFKDVHDEVLITEAILESNTARKWVTI